MSYLYLDSSAIAKLVWQERESGALAGYISRESKNSPIALAASVISRIEVMRAAGRRSGQAIATAQSLLRGINFFDLTPEIALGASTSTPRELRTLGAIHLMTAVHHSSGLHALVTYDIRLADAARLAGLPVEAPGATLFE